MKVKYKRVDSSVHGEVKEIKLIGEDEKDKNYFVFWINHTLPPPGFVFHANFELIGSSSLLGGS